MLSLVIIAAIFLVVVLAVICVIFPVFRTILGIAILLGMIYVIIKFLWNLFTGHTIPTAIEILLKIAIFLAFALVFLRTIVFLIAWYGGA